MVDRASSVENLVALPIIDVLANPDELTLAGALFVSGNTEAPLQPPQVSSWRRVAGRVAAGAALGGFLVLGMAQEAEATTTSTLDTAADQSTSQESGLGFGNWVTAGSLGLTALSVGVAGASLRSQNRDKKQDRFVDALQRVAGESDAEKRQAQLNVLAIYAEDPQHAPKVFRTAVEYLKARRSAIEYVRSDIEGGITGSLTPGEPTNYLDRLEKTMKPRRNADREMVRLLVKTLPAARERMQATNGSFIRRTIQSRIGTGQEDKLAALREITNLSPARKEGLVDAGAVNLDLMRDALVDCDLSGTSFNGAGMQANNITSVVFAGCDFQQAQLEGTTMLGCDLSGTDFRAAQFTSDPSDPYFMGKTTFIGCVIDKNTKFGRLPDNHPKARHNSNNPDQPDAYRGGGELTLKDLKVKPGTLSDDDMIELVHSWQRDGLKLSADSNPEYICI